MEFESLTAAARSWIPMLEKRADEVERARRLPDDLVRDLAAEGFYRMWVPADLRGLEMPLVPSLEVLESLAEGDPSVAWCIAIGITSSLALTSVPRETATTIFASPDTILAGVFAPTGRADACEEGFRVNGRWAFGSGTLNADWVLAGCRYFDDGEPIADESGQPRTNMVWVPRAEVEFLDTWHVSGLCGTGSTDFSMRDVCVSEAFIPGWQPSTRPGGPLYRIPVLTLLAVGFGAISLGLARSAVRELVTLAETKRGIGQSRRLAERTEVQTGVARAEARLRAARSLYYEAADALFTAAEASEVGVEPRVDMRLATNHAVDTAAEVATEMYHLGGGSSVYATSRLQRLFRDAHVITQHVQVRPELYAVMGSQLLGAPRGLGVL